MRRHGYVGRVANHLVADTPLAILGVALGQVQRPGDDAHAGEIVGQAPAEIFQVRPVIPIEAVPNLGTHVAQQKGLVQGRLAPSGVGGGDLVAAVVAAAEVVGELRAEFGGDGGVFDEDAVFSVCVVGREGGWCDVFGHPGGVAGAPVEGGGSGEGGVQVVDWAWETVLEEAVWVDGGEEVFELGTGSGWGGGRGGCLRGWGGDVFALWAGEEDCCGSGAGGCTDAGDDGEGGFGHACGEYVGGYLEKRTS